MIDVEPTPEVLAAFGVGGAPEPLAGGEGRAWRAADTVLKPCDDETEWSWLGEKLPTVREEGFRLALPIPARDGRWVVDGWSAQTALAGAHPSTGRWADVISVGGRLHRAMRHLEPPTFLEGRSHVWAVADRVAWGEEQSPAGSDLLDRLIATRRPLDLRSQLVHGDLAENVLFADGLAPAIIDMSPFHRPPGFATAIVVADALVWHAADTASLLQEVSRVESFSQLLIRALVFRVVASIGGGRASELDAYRSTVELAIRLG